MPIAISKKLRVRHHALLPLLSLFCFSGITAHAGLIPSGYSVPGEAPSPRLTESFDAGWKFSRFGLQPGGSRKAEPGDGAGKAGSPADAAYDDSTWRQLDLPHDWGAEGPFDITLPGETAKLPWKAIGWYRKTFTVPASDAGKAIALELDGAMANARIWINGKEVAVPPYGYRAISADLTPHVRFGAENTVAIRLDTENWDSRWYPGAGIYRHTRLVKTSSVRFAHHGIAIDTPTVSATEGRVHITAKIEGATSAGAVLKTRLFEALPGGGIGKPVAVADASQAAGEGVLKAAFAVANPRLWDITDPRRYVVVCTLESAGKTLDSVAIPFGFRTIKFTARDGFFLNGKRVEIKGVCQHHDLGALGSALNDRALERQFEILRDMGCNAIRTSHNPPSPEFLELADRMGFLVQVEAFDCWERGKGRNDYNKLFKKWHESDLKALVALSRNHPSVFMYSIGNEVWEQDKPELARRLADIVHKEDASRPVTSACNNPNAALSSGFARELDVMGFNYFENNFKRFEETAVFANQPYHSSESVSALSSRGEYFFPVVRGEKSRENFQVSSYGLDATGWGQIPDEQFTRLKKYPANLGEFIWTGFDYLGEPTPYSSDVTNLLNFRADPEKRAALEKQMKELGKIRTPSRSSYFGVIDLAGFPKDFFYAYRAHWAPEKPMAHLFPHWNWPERVGKVTPVHLYTSGDEAELFLNGKSLGRKKKGAFDFRLRWDEVKYEPGELKVVAYKNGKPWATDTVATTGAAAKLALTPDRAAIDADGRDLSFITLRITDDSGRTVPRSHNTVKFTVTGPGEIVATDNGDATDLQAFGSPERKAFNGLALAIVRLKPGASAPVTVRAESEGLAAGLTTLTPAPAR